MKLSQEKRYWDLKMNEWLKAMAWKKYSGAWDKQEILVDTLIITGVVVCCIGIYNGIYK